jgi:hypothetical protein
MKFLIISNPRSGSSSITNYFKQIGYNIGHETIFNDGVCSWMMAVNDKYPWGNTKSKNEYKFDNVIHLLRNPFDTIPSLILENKYSENNKSYLFRKKHIKKILNQDLTPYESNDLELATLTYIYWNQICSKNNPDYTIKIENLEDLDKFNNNNIDIHTVHKNKTCNKHFYIEQTYKILKKPKITKEQYNNLSNDTLNKLKSFCDQYNYIYNL